MKIPNIIYMRCVHLGKGGSVKMYVFMNFRQTVAGTVYARDRAAAKRKVKALHADAEFYR